MNMVYYYTSYKNCLLPHKTPDKHIQTFFVKSSKSLGRTPVNTELREITIWNLRNQNVKLRAMQLLANQSGMNTTNIIREDPSNPFNTRARIWLKITTSKQDQPQQTEQRRKILKFGPKT